MRTAYGGCALPRNEVAAVYEDEGSSQLLGGALAVLPVRHEVVGAMHQLDRHPAAQAPGARRGTREHANRCGSGAASEVRDACPLQTWNTRADRPPPLLPACAAAHPSATSSLTRCCSAAVSEWFHTACSWPTRPQCGCGAPICAEGHTAEVNRAHGNI